MRYVGQEHAVAVELPLELFRAEDRDGIKTRFDAVHATRHGYSAPGEKAEIVSLRGAITGLLRKPTFEPIVAGQPAPPAHAFRGARAVYFAELCRAVNTPTYDRASLLAENRIAGPALIEEYASTTVVHPGDVVTVDSFADPVTTEIVRNGLIAATEEMKTNLMRTAYNMIIYEALDFTVGLFDADGNTVSIGLGLPMFIRGMSDTVKTKLEHYGVENLDPGDILLTNDAYITGSHLNHMTFTVPIFHDGEVVAFSCCMAHWPDVGGTLDGATTDIFSEGLQMPIVKIYRKGVANEELISIIRTNVRLPERAMGDFRAQIAAVKTGERRFLEMIHKYGRDAVIGGIEAIMDHSEAVARARVREIPDGVYEAESFMDDDGVKLGERVPIRVRVEIAGDRMKVDLTDVAQQVAGFYNSGETAGRSCCQVAFKCLTSALDLPINDGQFRALEIVLPPGRGVSALKPAAMRMWMTYPMTIIDTIFKALAPAIPEHIIAGHHADLVVGRVNGRRPRDDSFYIYLGGLIGGGWGAKHNSDGCNATIAMNDGDTHNGPSEQVEAKYPLLVERYALRPDSGGAGRFRGGLGCEQVVQARHDLRFNSQMDRVKCKPWGLEGGLCGSGNSVAID